MSDYPYGMMLIALVGLCSAFIYAREPASPTSADVQVAQSGAASPAVQFPTTAYGPPAAAPPMAVVPSAAATEIPGARMFVPSPAMNPPVAQQQPIQPPTVRKPAGIPVQTAVPMPPPPPQNK